MSCKIQLGTIRVFCLKNLEGRYNNGDSYGGALSCVFPNVIKPRSETHAQDVPEKGT
jgi:hypothetical protein